jgi:small subunit ribosomal protein S6
LAVNLYEGMFVVDANKGGAEFPESIRLIAGLLKRHGAEIERMERWEERKLAYPIKRVKRGIYILTYFNVDGAAISELRRDIGLSEDILRVLIIRPDDVSPVQGQLFSPDGQEIEAPQPGPVAEAPKTEEAPPAEGGDDDAADDEGDDDDEDE